MQTGRSKQQRKDDTLRLLDDEIFIWLATATNDSEAHLIPMTYYWDGQQLTMATVEGRKTVNNLRRTGRARGAIGSGHEVVIVEGTVSFTSVSDIAPELAHAVSARWTKPIDFKNLPGFIFLHVTPQLIQAYRPGFVEMKNRTLMRDGEWLI